MTNGGIPLVKELRHPILKTMMAKDVVAFRTKYQAYVHQIDELNDQRAANNQIKPTELPHCVEPALLKSMVAMGMFDDHFQKSNDSDKIEDVSELNDAIMENWMKSRAEVDDADIAAGVSMALSQVTYRTNRADALGAVGTFFADILTKLEEHGCSSVLEHSGKTLAMQVLAMVQPKSVRDVIESEWKFWPGNDKRDFMKFQSYVSKKVVEASRWTGGKRGSDDVAPNESETEKKGSSRWSKKSKPNTRADKDGGRNEGNAAGSKAQGGSSATQKAAWTKKCLNPECDEMHPIGSCKKTGKDQAAQLLKKLWQGKASDKQPSAGLKTMVLKADGGTYEMSKPGGRWMATLGDATKVIAKGDDGADYSCIPRSVVGNLTQDGQKPVEHGLEKPLNLEGATKNMLIHAKGMIRADVTLQLSCGPLRLRNTEWLILEDDMSEILLGRPLLKALGFDVEEHLAANRAVLDNQSFDTGLLDQINSNAKPSVKAARTAPYTGLTYESVDPDPIDPVPSAEAAMGQDTEEEMKKAFADICYSMQKTIRFPLRV